MNRIAFALLTIAPEILMVTGLIWWVRRMKRNEKRMRAAWLKAMSPEAQRTMAELFARMNGKPYAIIKSAGGQTGIKCFKCERTSYHPQDVAYKYCGHCHRFHYQHHEETKQKG